MGDLVVSNLRAGNPSRVRVRSQNPITILQPFLDAIAANAAILDKTGTMVAINTAWRRFARTDQLKWSRVVLGANYLEVCDSVTGTEAAAATTVAQGIREVLEGKRETFEHEYPCHSSQEEGWFLMRVTRFISSGRIYALVAHDNITKFKQTERALRSNEERLRHLLESTNAIPWEADPQTRRYTYVGPQAAKVLGYPLETWYEDGFWASHLYPNDRERVIAFYRNATGKCDTFECEYRMISAEGEPVWLHDLASCNCEHGQPKILRGFMIDITYRRKAEEDLLETEQRFRTLADTAPVMIWVSGLDKGCTYFNKRWLEFTGRMLEEECGNGWADGVHPGDVARCFEIYQHAFDRQESFTMEYRLRRHDGEYRWVIDSGTPRFTPHGIFSGFVGSAIDITESKRADGALRESDQRMRTLFDSAPEAMVIYDVDAGRFIDVNENAVRLFGLPRATLLSMSPFHFSLTPHLQPNGHRSKDYGREKLQEALAGGQPNFEWLHYDTTGKHIICAVQLARLPRAGQNLVWASIRDVTQHKQAAAQLQNQHETLQRQGNKLRSLAAQLITVQDEERRRMACELHDDTSQRLALVAQRISFLQRELPGSAAGMSSELTELRSQVVQISTDVRRLAHELHPSVLDDLGLEVAAQSYAEDFAKHRGIEVQFTRRKLPRKVPREPATCLYRVMQESLGNVAKHAHTCGASVSFRGYREGILLVVRDQGVGLPAKLHEESREGLGLVSMRERARLVKGTLSIRSEPGKGTRVRCWVPLGGTDT